VIPVAILTGEVAGLLGVYPKEEIQDKLMRRGIKIHF
jgi:hypothetical protein